MDKNKKIIGAYNLVNICAGLKKNEKALIITDYEKIDIAMTLKEEIKKVGSEYTIAIMEPRKDHGENPTKAIVDAMMNVDVIFAPTKYSLTHSTAREEANENGVRFISMPDYSIEMLKGGALEADFLGMLPLVDKFYDVLTKGKNAEIIFENEMTLKLNIEDRVANKVSGVCTRPGLWGSPPNIEVNVSPREDKSNGEIYVNGSIPIPEIGVVDVPIILSIDKGKISSISDNKQGKIFSKKLMEFNNENSYILGELGIGLNPKAKIKGSMLEDEGAYGTIHFGWGHNYDQGGLNSAPSHIDTVTKNSTLIIDGKTIIEKGNIII